MEGKRIIKLKNQKSGKKIDFPNNFSSLIKKIIEFIPLNDPTKRYQLIEEKSQKEIATEEDFVKMSDEYKNEKLIKITVNLIDKNINFISNEKPEKNIISTEASINLLNDKKEEKEDIENPVQSILKEKMKELEDKLVEELYNNLQNEISKSKINNNSESNKDKNNFMSKIIHKGIKCNKCGKNNLEGIRYKCAQCPDFNLCETCENNYNHNIKHIMVKMRYPAKNENELKSKINRNISYKNQDMNYDLEPKEFKLEKDVDTYSFMVTLKNTGGGPWKGVSLRCIDDKSDLVGEDCDISYSVYSGSSVNQQIQFSDIKSQLEKEKKNIYYCFFQMFNQHNETFGNVTKIKITI